MKPELLRQIHEELVVHEILSQFPKPSLSEQLKEIDIEISYDSTAKYFLRWQIFWSDGTEYISLCYESWQKGLNRLLTL